MVAPPAKSLVEAVIEVMGKVYGSSRKTANILVSTSPSAASWVLKVMLISLNVKSALSSTKTALCTLAKMHAWSELFVVSNNSPFVKGITWLVLNKLLSQQA